MARLNAANLNAIAKWYCHRPGGAWDHDAVQALGVQKWCVGSGVIEFGIVLGPLLSEQENDSRVNHGIKLTIAMAKAVNAYPLCSQSNARCHNACLRAFLLNQRNKMILG